MTLFKINLETWNNYASYFLVTGHSPKNSLVNIMHLEQEAPLEGESSITKSDNGDFNNSKYCLVTLFFSILIRFNDFIHLVGEKKSTCVELFASAF